MKRLPSFSLAAASLVALVACGGISDPTQGSGEQVATVSGALTGTSVPSGTRVALVWRVGNTGTYAVGSDVAVVDGKFTMDLNAPPNSYFFAAEGTYDDFSDSSAHSDPPTARPPAADNGGVDQLSFGLGLAPRDTVSGQINQPLSAAAAGFVVYVDTNGNGALDIAGQWATATDQVIGGNDELLLTYFRDGGALDYEKLRDRSGILPKAGYNLAWSQGRWVPLNVVELKIKSNIRLPSGVCATDIVVDDSPPPIVQADAGVDSGVNGFPSPDDPTLICSDDGYTFSYQPAAPCGNPQPTPEGLCAPQVFSDSCASPGGGFSIPYGSALPEGWPCPVDVDGGVFEDAGVPEDGGAADAGAGG
jgi:hypothetical protein